MNRKNRRNTADIFRRYALPGILFALLLCGCSNMFDHPGSPVAGSRQLLVSITEPAIGRTAIPSVTVSEYKIKISNASDPADVVAAEQGGFSGTGPFAFALTALPDPGTVLWVSGWDSSNRKIAEGSLPLEASHMAGYIPINVEIKLLAAGTGTVDLKLQFPQFSGDNEITSAEFTWYQNLTAYNADNPFMYQYYRKPGGAGAGTEFTIPGAGKYAITLHGENIPSGSIIVKAEFKRASGVTAKIAVESFIVRDNLTTNRWQNPAGTGLLETLEYTGADFLDSDAELASFGGTLGGTEPLQPYSDNPLHYYGYVASASSIDMVPTFTLKPGQTIAISVNGAADSSIVSGASFPIAPDTSSYYTLTVTAADRKTTKVYRIDCTVYENDPTQTTVRYVAPGGIDGPPNTGASETSPFKTVSFALMDIATIPSGSLKGIIYITGNLTEDEASTDNMIEIIGPMGAGVKINEITILGYNGGGTIDASGKNRRVLHISSGAKVTIGEGVTITGGTTSVGGAGVYITDSGTAFTMLGGKINGNTAAGTTATPSPGGGIYAGNGASLTIRGGIISGNSTINTTNDTSWGGGIFMDSGSFSMSGGTIGGSGIGEENSATNTSATRSGYGGGVYLQNSTFNLEGTAQIIGNKAEMGAGVYLTYSASGTVTMKESAKIAGNKASLFGGGVYLKITGSAVNTFNMQDTVKITGNQADGPGGGVYMISDSNGSASAFTMKNTAQIEENQSIGGGGGINLQTTGSGAVNFYMQDTAQITGNQCEADGGGVSLSGAVTFTMTGGTIGGAGASKNTADQGGGVYVAGGAALAMSGTSSIIGNSASNSGGGVYLNDGTFTMSGYSTVTPNDDNNDVYLSDTMIKVTGTLSSTLPAHAARITPSAYTPGKQVLDGTGTDITANYTKFEVTPSDKTWSVDSTGKLNSANLDSLTFNAGTLSPAFSKEQTTYDLNSAGITLSLEIIAPKTDPGGSVKMNGDTVNPGDTKTISVAALLLAGNKVTIIVTAEDGSTKTYLITVHII
jgi:hypothetical protein